MTKNKQNKKENKMTSNFDVLMGLGSVLDFSECWVVRESELDYFQSLLSDQERNKEIKR